MTQEQIEQIYLWWHLFKNDGKELCEIRCLDGQNTYSGYYHSAENIIRDITPLYDLPNMQFYFVLNTINEACYDRQQHERLERKPKNTTSDNDIAGRDFLLLDFDPIRPSGIGSTNEELELAHKKALQVFRYLKDQGFSQPIVTQSGNGWHLYYKVQLSKSIENTKLVERFLKALSMLFSDEKVGVDTSVHNLSRITKLVGTYAKKGANTAEHPWRLSKIVKYPETVEPTPKAYIEKIANLYPDEQPKPTKENNYGRERFDIVNFLNKHNIEYKAVKTSLGTRYLLEHCPFDHNHTHGDAMVFQHDNGGLAFSCFHASCQHYSWSDFRLMFEPDAYEKKDYQEFRAKQRYHEKYQIPQQHELLQESDELGKKWLTLRDIKTVKQSEKFAIHTGITALDKAIGGLYEGETTILSGINASGKTALLNQLILTAIQQNVPTALWSGEMPTDKLKSLLCQNASGKQNVHKVPNRENSYEANDEVIQKIEDWIDERLVIYNTNYGNNFEQIISDILEAIEKYGIKYVLIDNLMALSLEDLAGTLNEQQKALMLRLDRIAKEKKVHILIVAHPRKEANFQLLRKESISGSSDLTNITWNLLLIHRVGDDFAKRATEFWGKERTQTLILEGYTNIIEVAKNRDDGVVDYTVGIFYEAETRRFKNYKAENIHYDWEERYEEYTVPEQSFNQIQPNQSFDTPIEPLYQQENDDAYWGQFRNSEEPPF